MCKSYGRLNEPLKSESKFCFETLGQIKSLRKILKDRAQALKTESLFSLVFITLQSRSWLSETREIEI